MHCTQEGWPSTGTGAVALCTSAMRFCTASITEAVEMPLGGSGSDVGGRAAGRMLAASVSTRGLLFVTGGG